MFPLAFLRQLGKHARDSPSGEDGSYNDMVKAAWGEFGRDSKNFAAQIRQLKYQQYFDDKLKRMADAPALGRRAKRLMPFVRGRMMINRQPYQKLAALGREIDGNLDMGGEAILSRLEAIRGNYGAEYKRLVSRPRILYSVMVGKR